ncbi:MAG TPA: ATP/GTP-binding protein [Thermoplasmata archaeon]|nr:ATP/GTP-binding protein [Thermoplasmata archaeon]
MEEPGTIYFTGTAGAGKTSLVRAFADWARSAGYDATVVNLDPGSEAGEDSADVDIREWVRLADLQDEYGLGPNGAQVVAADMIALKVFEVKQAIQEQSADYVLIDTPGQIELFAFREASKAIVDALSGDRSVLAFLYDPVLARTAAGFVSLLMLGATVEFRFRLPVVNLLAKSDVLTPDQLREVMSWSEDPGELYEAIQTDAPTPDVQLSTELFRAIETMAPLVGLVPTSAKAESGLEDMYRAFQRVFAGGEDLEPSHAPTNE